MGKYRSNLIDPKKTRVDMRDCTGHAIELERKNIMAEGMIISFTATLCLIILGAGKCQGHKGIRIDSSYYCKIFMSSSALICDLTTSYVSHILTPEVE